MTHNPLPNLFIPVAEAVVDAHLVAWDGCHKMYLAMDEEEAESFRDGYPHIVEGTAEEMLTALLAWWDESCGLRFINAVHTDHDDPNAGYISLIPQFADDEDDDDEDEDEDDDDDDN